MKIDQASRRTGISTQMIRFYEKKGILSPKRDPRNGYRDYDEHDLYIIVLARQYQSFGMTLRSISNIFNGNALDLVQEELQQTMENLSLQKQWIDAKIFFAQDYASIFQTIKEQKDHDTGTRPQLYYYPGMDASDSSLSVHQLYVADGISRSILRVTKENSTKEFPKDDGMLFLIKHPDPHLFYETIPAHTYYRAFIRIDSGHRITAEVLREIFTKAEAEGHTLQGDIWIYQVLGSGQQKDQFDLVCVEFDTGKI